MSSCIFGCEPLGRSGNNESLLPAKADPQDQWLAVTGDRGPRQDPGHPAPLPQRPGTNVEHVFCIHVSVGIK